jgi:molybdopterin-guanine dinucleotide biosynthesis protein A
MSITQLSETLITGIILAGGRSSRMGKNKALLPLPGNQTVTFVEHLASLLAPCCADVLVVARDQAHAAGYILPGVRVVYDKMPGYGPLIGLYSGLGEIHTQQALVVAVDMPFVHPPLLSFLISQAQALPQDALLVPLVNNVPQVLLAVYPRSVLPLIEDRIKQGRRDPRGLLETAPVHYIEEAQLRRVDPQFRSFININTPGELEELR